MKWYECIEDLGDGSNATRRFRDLETANAWLEKKISNACGDYTEWDCYPLGPLEEVDTDSPYFWDDIDEED